MVGPRDMQTSLWNIPLKTDHRESNINNIKSVKFMVRFLYKSLFSPVLSTLKQVIKHGYLHLFPRLNDLKNFICIEDNYSTIKDNLDTTRKNIISTKNIESEEPILDNLLNSEVNIKTNVSFASIQETGNIYTDQTGKFPHISSQRNE